MRSDFGTEKLISETDDDKQWKKGREITRVGLIAFNIFIFLLNFFLKNFHKSFFHLIGSTFSDKKIKIKNKSKDIIIIIIKNKENEKNGEKVFN